MAKVIEFYVPNNFSKRVKWLPPQQRGRVIEFGPPTKKSACNCTNSGAIRAYPRRNLTAPVRLCGRSYAMTSQQQRVWNDLCLKAVMERNRRKQMAIVVELNRILQNQKKSVHCARVTKLSKERSV